MVCPRQLKVVAHNVVSEFMIVGDRSVSRSRMREHPVGIRVSTEVLKVKCKK